MSDDIIITKGGRDWMILLLPLIPRSEPEDARARAVAAGPDDLIAGLGVVRDFNEPGRARTLEEERDAALAAAIDMEAKLALALDLLEPEMKRAAKRDMPRSPRDVALRALAGAGATSYMLTEWRTARALVREGMQVIAGAREGIWPKKRDVDALLGRMATAMRVLLVVR